MAKSILYITIDPLEYRRRIFNQIKVAQDLGFDITVVSIAQTAMDYDDNQYDFDIKRIRVPFKGGPLKFIWFNIKTLWIIVFRSYDVMHLRGLWVLPAFLLYRLFHRPFVIYDAHEFFAGHQIWDDRPLKKRLWLLVERLAVPFIDHLVTVSQPILELFKKRYPKINNLTLIRNLPSLTNRINPKERDAEFNPPLKLVFHGYFLRGRALPHIITVMDHLKELPIELILIGEGPLENMLKFEVKKRALQATIAFHPMVPYGQLTRFISRNHIGLSLNEPDCLNRRYALGNKFFEYLMAGLAVIATDIETKRFYIDRHQIGALVDADNIVEDLIHMLTDILNRPGQLQQWRINARKASLALNWESESRKLKDIYRHAAS